MRIIDSCKIKIWLTGSTARSISRVAFLQDRRSAILVSIRIDADGCSSLILLLSFRSAEPLYPARFCISTSCAKQAYEKGHGAHIPVAPCHNRHPGVTIPTSPRALSYPKTGFIYATINKKTKRAKKKFPGLKCRGQSERIF